MKRLKNAKISALHAGILAIGAAFLAVALFCWMTLKTYGKVIYASAFENTNSVGTEQTGTDLSDEDIAKLNEVSALLHDRFVGETSTDELVDGAVNGMVGALDDVWSYYIPLEEITEYSETVSNQYVGIGVTVEKQEAGLYIADMTPGSGAADAGLEIGDYIVKADGIDITELDLDTAKAHIVGDEGTFVEIEVVKSSGETVKYSVERRKITTYSVSGEMIEGNTAYIKIDNFYNGSAKTLIEITDSLIAQGAEAVVYDVRFNPGGYLDELLSMLDYILPEGTIFISQDAEGNRETFTSDKSCIKIPMAVLINDASFSAAEFFAEALNEYEWAITVGLPTVGKGYSQQTYPLSDGSAIAVSTHEYFTPNGKSLAGVGITPDIPVTIDEEEYIDIYLERCEYSDDTQLQEALKALK